MAGDSSNRRTFLKVAGLTAVSTLLPTGLGMSVASAAPAAMGGAVELWLLDTGLGTLDADLYTAARQDLANAVAARGESLPY
ncbi:hypothetical protein JY651_37555 [Pyxidicoccus parkwayensis]|uniref:Uncharacterized protein n=1 Tax=Pyxidicoccus parkwayensis TaxID=2813578 RepID=A0ABX7NRB6_9BACT|nr:hypothetical protein [Pyxidicoccus parkwaysis]QSQ20889.1 hypothetical protein JY651_37555 [Pyxidicoccus parkwaysis]